MISRIANKIQRETISLLFKIGLDKYVINPKSGSIILMYHGIDLIQNNTFNGRFIGIKQFEKQLILLKKYFDIAELSEIFKNKQNVSSRPKLAITLDDGYENNFKYALPLLEKHQCPATFFITGANKSKTEILWADLLDIASTLTNKEIFIDSKSFIKNIKTNQYFNLESGLLLKTFIKKDGNSQLKDELKIQFSNEFSIIKQNSKYDDYWKLMTDNDIVQTSKSEYVSIGSHAFSHNNLGNIPFAESSKDLDLSKSYLENLIQKPINTLSFPDGSYSRELIDYAYKLGFIYQVAVEYKYNDDIDDCRIIDRYGIYPIYNTENTVYDIIKKTQ